MCFEKFNIQWWANMQWYVVKSGSNGIVIFFGWSFRLSLKLKSFLTESRKESEKYLGLSPWKILYPLTEVKCLDKKGNVRRLSEEDRSLVEIKWNGICCIFAIILNARFWSKKNIVWDAYDNMTCLAQSHNSVNQNIIAMHDSQGYDDRTADFVNKREIL